MDVRLLSIAAVAAEQPRVENRPAKPDETGYRPADGSSPPLNPPTLVWLHQPEAHRYTAQWATRLDFRDALTAAELPWNTYTHHTPLAPGQYFWRYRFTTLDGATSGWSATRSFTVTTGAAAFPMPTRAQQRERVPAGRPRLFMRPEALPRLKELSRGAEASRFAALRAEADRLLETGPTPEPTVMASAHDPATTNFWWPNRLQTQTACMEAETLAFVSLLTGEPRYAEAARRWVLHLARWSPDGPTNFRLNCEAAKPMLFRLPRAYDWAYDALTPEERAQVREVMKRRALDAWKSGEVKEGVGHLNQPYSSHGNRTWHKLGECAIAFLGEIPEAETWLDYAVNKFYACYPVWADDDGGWHEGVSYWAGYMGKVVWWLQAAHAALGIDGFQKPFFAQVGDFPLYVAPPNSPNMGFGDLSHGRPAPAWGAFLEYFLRGSRSPSRHYWRWWMEQWRMEPADGVMGFLYSANLPALPDPKPPVDLPPSKVFRGTGLASLHSTLLSADDDVHVLFKSSPFGSRSHGHNPQNNFQLNAYGESLLTTCVYRDLHGSAFHYQWAHSTVAHNAVLVNGEGQVKHTPEPLGRIAEHHLSPELDYVAGDAADAYAGRLTRYRRHIAFARPDLVVILDDLTAAERSTFQFMLHALRPFELDELEARLAVEQPRAGVVVRYLSPTPLAFRQWDGYDPPPYREGREFPNQWHVEAGTREKHTTLAVLTVILPHRAGQRTDWTAERLETDTALAARVTRAGIPTTIAFRKHGVVGPASLDGRTFEGPVAKW